MKKRPVFLHSLFRSGSTYVFNAFRKLSQSYLSYQEPFNEQLLISAHDERLFGDGFQDVNVELRHPRLEQAYFWEYSKILPKIRGILTTDTCYEEFFSDLNENVREYITLLLAQTEKTPVLQFCRSWGRISSLTGYFNPINIHLIRNPWDQWYSYNVNDYFPVTNMFILGATSKNNLVLERLRKHLNFVAFKNSNIEKEFNFYRITRLSASQEYELFFAFWCLSYLAIKEHAEIEIDIDKFSYNSDYMDEIRQSFIEHDLVPIDISSSNIPVRKFSCSDIKFFKVAQDRIMNLLSQELSGICINSLSSYLDVKQPHSLPMSFYNTPDDDCWKKGKNKTNHSDADIVKLNRRTLISYKTIPKVLRKKMLYNMAINRIKRLIFFVKTRLIIF